jgi:hypothetical protein
MSFRVVVAERLFGEIAEQVEGLDRNISAIDAALQERPVVLKAEPRPPQSRPAKNDLVTGRMIRGWAKPKAGKKMQLKPPAERKRSKGAKA